MADIDPVERAENLIVKAELLDDRITKQTEQVIKELVTYKNRAVKWQILTSAMMLILIFMLVVGAFALIKIRDNSANIQDFCEATNKSNDQQITLWRFILEIPPRADETASEKQTKVDFTDLVERTFAPIDCSQQKVVP